MTDTAIIAAPQTAIKRTTADTFSDIAPTSVRTPLHRPAKQPCTDQRKKPWTDQRSSLGPTRVRRLWTDRIRDQPKSIVRCL